MPERGHGHVVCGGVPGDIVEAPGLTPLPGKGRWAAGRVGAGGAPAIFTTFERPDPLHPSVVVGVARIDTHATIGAPA